MIAIESLFICVLEAVWKVETCESSQKMFRKKNRSGTQQETVVHDPSSENVQKAVSSELHKLTLSHS